MESKIKYQQGYLLIVAVILILIIGFIASIIAYMYVGTTKSNTNMLLSNQAFYIAKSGLEIVRGDLLRQGSTLQCSGINNAAKYTNACYPPGASSCIGYFTVTVPSGAQTVVNTTLAASINSTTTSVTLSSTAGLLPNGVIWVDREAIGYSGAIGGALQNVYRGALNTIADAHNSGANVVQDVCVLQCAAGIPSLTNPMGKRVIEEQVYTGINRGLGSLPGGVIPSVVASGTVKLTGRANVENNSIVNTNDKRLTAAAIVSGLATTFTGIGTTAMGTNCTYDMVTGALTPGCTGVSSQPLGTQKDVWQSSGTQPPTGSAANYTIDYSKLWSYYFKVPKPNRLSTDADIFSNFGFDITTNPKAMYVVRNCGGSMPNLDARENGVRIYDGKIIYVICSSGSFVIRAGTSSAYRQVGSPTSPVTLILDTGSGPSDITNAYIKIYGFIYVVNNDITISNDHTQLLGSIAVEGDLALNNAPGVAFDSGVLTQLGLIQPNLTCFIAQEIFK